ncbi:hypothetical protein [Mucilaginibacter terrae]|uniref:FimB/Mfa2 family fimbrial subunit n=1 Tax=Mucilaginibacter terrae TaxID=1955052 RepID=A0ABU3GYR3_9SPHI|nr:hypothetical protein [Mucilaginibacter terrae]MDT3404910.1 hypothetical protein [Mucilaginibacter terrae]
MLIACKKDNNSIQTEIKEVDKVPLSFAVTTFNQTQAPFSVKSPSQKNTLASAPVSEVNFTKLMFVVFDSDGNQVSRLEQFKTDVNKLYRIKNGKRVLMNSSNAFGTLTDTLKAGKYTVLATGGGGLSSLNSSIGSTDQLTPKTLTDAKFSPLLYNYTDDVFYYKGELNVVAGAPIQSITMDRIVGKVEIAFEYIIPANVRSITVEIMGEKQNFRVNTNVPEDDYKRSNVFQLDESGLPKSNYKISMLVLNTVSPFNVTVTSFGGVATSKTIQNVTVTKNTRTILSGKLFSDPASSATVTVNNVWGADNPTIKC